MATPVWGPLLSGKALKYGSLKKGELLIFGQTSNSELKTPFCRGELKGAVTLFGQAPKENLPPELR